MKALNSLTRCRVLSEGCQHDRRRCLNEYDTYRKYLCLDCGMVYMCACEEELARQFLPHQLHEGREDGTRKRYPVAGFAPGLCPACRNEDQPPHPMAAVRGRKGKIERFYWREITKTYHAFARAWLIENSEHASDILEFQKRFPDTAKDLRKRARQHWQREHKSKPKYDLSEPTQQDLHDDVDVPESVVHAPYGQVQRADQRLGKWQNSAGELVSAEAIAKDYYWSQGWTSYDCERKLISVLYGTFCFPVVQALDDPLIIVGYRNSTRGWTKAKPDTGLIAIPLPQDFGSPVHFQRRSSEYSRLFSCLRGECLSDLFEEWLEPSKNLRDYLWVNEDAAVTLARKALRVIPVADILGWIEWAAGDFWQRQPGWPDLFLVRDTSFRFVEVKSPLDKLSQEQLRWFRWALGEARVPCEVCRVRKSK